MISRGLVFTLTYYSKKMFFLSLNSAESDAFLTLIINGRESDDVRKYSLKYFCEDAVISTAQQSSKVTSANI